MPEGSEAPAAKKSRNFRHLKHATKEEFDDIGTEYEAKVQAAEVLADRFLSMMQEQKKFGLMGQPVDLCQHGEQCASLVYRSEERKKKENPDYKMDIDLIVMSLLHDVTETVVAKNHGKAIGALLEPYLPPKYIWMLATHEIFQGFYYFEYYGGNKLMRDSIKPPEGCESWHQELIDWCEDFDAAAFDGDFTDYIDVQKVFRPMLIEVLSRPGFWWDKKHPLTLAVTGEF